MFHTEAMSVVNWKGFLFILTVPLPVHIVTCVTCYFHKLLEIHLTYNYIHPHIAYFYEI